MFWVLYLVVSGQTLPYHEQGEVKQFKSKADCERVLKVEAKELVAKDGVLAGQKIGKDFVLICKKEKN